VNLWWIHLSSEQCSFNEVTNRQCIPIGWSELNSLERHIKNIPHWERRLKSYIQLKGDVAYSKNASWKDIERNFEEVPEVFVRMLSIKRNDLIIAIESGHELHAGRPTIKGIARVTEDAFSSYQYNSNFRHAHSVCPNTQWLTLDSFHMSELNIPYLSFRTLCSETSQLKDAISSWQIAAEQSADMTA